METPPNKRRKTQLACNACRARKTGCDGKRPHCTSCTLRGWQRTCSYQERAAPPTNLTLEDLDKRLAKLEGGEIPPTSSPFNQTRGWDDSSLAISREYVARSNGLDAQAGRHLPLLTPGFTPGSEAAEDQPVFGTPSNSAFTQQLATVISSAQNVGPSPKTPQVIPTPLGYVPSQPFTTKYSADDLRLPIRTTADSLLQCYWDLFHPLFPILHRPSFEADYQRVWEPVTVPSLHTKSLAEVIFYSTLNIVLAIGSQRNEALNESERELLSDELCKRSVRLVSLDTLNTSSLAIVQLLLLRGTYLLYTTSADRCWNTVGVAVRSAQAIGLHITEQGPLKTSQVTREMRRRVWCSCMNLDWMASITFGRPTAIPRDTPVPVPASIDDEYLSATGKGQQPEGTPSRLEFFARVLKFLDIRERLQAFEIYRPAKQGITINLEKDLSTVLELNMEIDRFCEELPPHLLIDDNSDTARVQSCFELQSRVLRARIMYTRLRILRPLIIAEAYRCITTTSTLLQVNTTTPKLSLRIWADMCQLCLSTAHDVLNELHMHLSHVNRTSPWHTLYFAFAAASVLIAASLCPFLELRLDTGRGKLSWNKAMEIFQFHKAHVASADKGIETMQRLKKGAEDRGTHVDETPRSSSVQSPDVAVPISAVSHTIFDDPATPNNFDDLGEILDAELLDQNWFTSQDFGVDDWMLHLA